MLPTAGTRSPSVRMPARFSGSAALITIGSPAGACRLISRDALDRLRQRELFAGHAGDEPAAPDLTARFESPEHPQQLAPWHGVRLTRQQAAADDAVAQQQRAGVGLDRRLAIGIVTRRAAGTRDHRPPAGRRCGAAARVGGTPSGGTRRRVRTTSSATPRSRRTSPSPAHTSSASAIVNLARASATSAATISCTNDAP